MAERHHWTYATLEEAYQDADAFNEAAGLPAKGRHIKGKGKERHVEIPDTYTEGAPGWTGELVGVDERAGGGPANEAFGIDSTSLTDALDGVTVDHPRHGRIKTPAKKAARKKGSWTRKTVRPRRPKAAKGVKRRGIKSVTKARAAKEPEATAPRKGPRRG